MTRNRSRVIGVPFDVFEGPDDFDLPDALDASAAPDALDAQSPSSQATAAMGAKESDRTNPIKPRVPPDPKKRL